MPGQVPCRDAEPNRSVGEGRHLAAKRWEASGSVRQDSQDRYEALDRPVALVHLNLLGAQKGIPQPHWARKSCRTRRRETGPVPASRKPAFLRRMKDGKRPKQQVRENATAPKTFILSLRETETQEQPRVCHRRHRAARGVREGADDKCWLLVIGLLVVRALGSRGEWAPSNQQLILTKQAEIQSFVPQSLLDCLHHEHLRYFCIVVGFFSCIQS